MTLMTPLTLIPTRRSKSSSVVPLIAVVHRKPRTALFASVFPDEIHNNTDQHRDCEYYKGRIHVLFSFFSADLE